MILAYTLTKKTDILSGMDENKQRDLIIKRLVSHRAISDIVQEVCEQTGMYWDDAEALVNEIAHSHEVSIRKKRSPIVVAMAMAIFVGGVGLLVMTVFVTSNIILFYRSTQPEVLSTINILLLLANEAPLALGLGSLGLAMIAGSMLGMRDVWLDWLQQ